MLRKGRRSNPDREKTGHHYKAQVKTHIKPGLGAVKLANLAPHNIQGFYNKLQREGRVRLHKDKTGKLVIERSPLSAKSIRNVHGILTKALSVAVDMGYIRSNPADRVTLPRVEKKEIRPLTDEQVAAFLKEVDTDDFCILFKTTIFTGMREAEAIGLTWDCIDFQSGRITVKKQLQKLSLIHI